MILNPYRTRIATLHEATYTYLSVERSVLADLSQKATFVAEKHWGMAWHKAFIAQPENAFLADWKNPKDPFYLLKAIAFNRYSSLISLLGADQNLAQYAAQVFHARNLWLHHAQVQQMSGIKNNIWDLVKFAQLAHLESYRAAKSAYEALNIALDQAPHIPIKRGKEKEERRTITNTALPQGLRRPRVGALWEEFLPLCEAMLDTKLKDLTDAQTGESLKHLWETEELADEAIERWVAMRPTYLRMFHDPKDGAIVGYLERYPCLFGYIGEEPYTLPEQHRGFLGQVTFTLRRKKFRNEVTGQSFHMRPKALGELIENLFGMDFTEGSAFRMTNYGDLVHLSEDGPVRILTLRTKY